MRRLNCSHAPGRRATEKSALIILLTDSIDRYQAERRVWELEEEVVEQLVALYRSCSVGREDCFLIKERLFQLADALDGARQRVAEFQSRHLLSGHHLDRSYGTPAPGRAEQNVAMPPRLNG